MEEINFGQYALPVILTAFLGFVYKFLDGIPDRWKPVISICLGMILALIGLKYADKPWIFPIIVDHLLYGFMVGASAVGIYEISRAARNPRL